MIRIKPTILLTAIFLPGCDGGRDNEHTLIERAWQLQAEFEGISVEQAQRGRKATFVEPFAESCVVIEDRSDTPMVGESGAVYCFAAPSGALVATRRGSGVKLLSPD